MTMASRHLTPSAAPYISGHVLAIYPSPFCAGKIGYKLA